MRQNCSLLTALFVCILLYGCSIKEDRGPCPCHLTVKMNDSASLTDKITLMGWGDAHDNLFTDRIKTSDFPEKYTKKIDKGNLMISAFGGIEGMVMKNGILTIPEGKQCDSCRAYRSGTIDATGEFAEDSLVLHKEFSRIHIKVDGKRSEQSGIILMANGNICGYDIATLVPHNGKFSCFADMISDDEFLISVPRQTDSSLLMEIYLDGVLFNTIRIGEMIEKSGFSWSKEDLDDIYLSVNIFSDMNVSISINGWDTERITYTI